KGAEKIGQRLVADLDPFDPPMHGMSEFQNKVLLIHSTPLTTIISTTYSYQPRWLSTLMNFRLTRQISGVNNSLRYPVHLSIRFAKWIVPQVTWSWVLLISPEQEIKK